MEKNRRFGGWHWWPIGSVPVIARRPDTSPIAIFRSRYLARTRDSRAREISRKTPAPPPRETRQRALPRYPIQATQFGTRVGLGPGLRRVEQSASAEMPARSKSPAEPDCQNLGRAAAGIRIPPSQSPPAAESQRTQSRASPLLPEKRRPMRPARPRAFRPARCSSVWERAKPGIFPRTPNRSTRRPTGRRCPPAARNAQQKNRPCSPPESRKRFAAAADEPPNRPVRRPIFAARTAESTRVSP